MFQKLFKKLLAILSRIPLSMDSNNAFIKILFRIVFEFTSELSSNPSQMYQKMFLTILHYSLTNLQKNSINSLAIPLEITKIVFRKSAHDSFETILNILYCCLLVISLELSSEFLWNASFYSKSS